MADQKFIEQTSQKITAILLEVQEKAIAEIYALQGNLKAEQFIKLIDNLDVKAIISAKSANAVNTFTNSHVGVLESMVGFASISEETIQSLINYNRETLISKLDNMAQTIKKEVVKGVIAGSPVQTVLDAVRGQEALSSRQLQTLIETSMSVYSRSINKVMMDKMPNETKYVYIGPADSVTRDECLEYILAGELTLAEIESNGWGDSLLNGGGWNCRHEWQLSTEKKIDYNPKQAEQLKK